MLPTANWSDWYQSMHERRSLANGQAFEDYVASVLSLYHDDYFNPDPAGTLGDGGCDGLASSGSILYAIYGTRAVQKAEQKLRDKIQSDFERGLANWHQFNKWRFVTNANARSMALQYVTTIQNQHGPSADRPLTIRIWRPTKLWHEVVRNLSSEDLDELFPGAPGIANLELSDLVPLLDVLSQPGEVDRVEPILEVPAEKMDFNQLSDLTRLEFNAGRRQAHRIDRWFREHSDPSLRDAQGETFKRLYVGHREVVDDPSEVVERLYVSLAGPNPRMDSRRANATYAVTSYFFDSCHIFEDPSSSEREWSDVLT